MCQVGRETVFSIVTLLPSADCQTCLGFPSPRRLPALALDAGKALRDEATLQAKLYMYVFPLSRCERPYQQSSSLQATIEAQGLHL